LKGLILLQDYKKLVYSVLIISLIYFIAKSLGFVVVPFVVGFIFAYILDKPVTYLEKFKIPRALASFLIVLSLVVVFVSLILISLPFFKNEILKLTNASPRLIYKIKSEFDDLIAMFGNKLTDQDTQQIVNQIKGEFINIASWFMNLIINFLGNGIILAHAVTFCVLTPIIIFYLVKDWAGIVFCIRSVLPKKYSVFIVNKFSEIDHNLSSYAKGQTLACLILMALYTVSLWIFGLNYAVIVGIITGIISFIPYAGAVIGFFISVIIALQQFESFNPVFKIALIFFVIQFLEGYFIVPRFVGEKIGLHPVWIIFSLLAGISWFGLIGLVLAIPVATIARVLITSIKENYAIKN
jgi:predicted PurR-regulated permease PerM